MNNNELDKFEKMLQHEFYLTFYSHTAFGNSNIHAI